ncbi:TPA: helix-turn-helix transcriptional regulator, partial [Enterococcus faecium]|nr:helix-turn-helix transcriptional regulator [Enterococcus faecium]
METRDYITTHQKLIESGLSHFEKVGFQQTKIRQLCLTAGVTTGAFYKHFTSKEALFEEI